MNRLLLLLAILGASLAYADHSTSMGFQSPVNVRFEFPNRTVRETTLSVGRCNEIFKRKPLPKDVWVDSYKIDWWIFAALQDLGLPFRTKTTGKTGGPWKTAILQIGEYLSGPKGQWIYFVNGIRSRYHISTQLDSGLKSIKFIYETTK